MKTLNLQLIQKVFLLCCLLLILRLEVYGQSSDIDRTSLYMDKNILITPIEKADATRLKPLKNIDTIIEEIEIPAWIISGPKVNSDHPYFNKGYPIKSEKSTGYVTLSFDESISISDLEQYSRTLHNHEILPNGATIVDVIYAIKVDDNGVESNFYPKDYYITIYEESLDHFDDIYSGLGTGTSHTDEGFDDDLEDDSDIWLNYRHTNAFNGQDASQDFSLHVSDMHSPGEGILEYFHMRITWEAPDLPNLVTSYIPPDWSAPIMTTHASGAISQIQDPILYAGVDTYLWTSFNNISDYDCTEPFYFDIMVDGSLHQHIHYTDVESYEYWRIRTLYSDFTAGQHTICQDVDATGLVMESNEDDNEYCMTFTWVGPPVTPALSSPADGSGCQSTDLTLSWNASANATSYGLQVDNNADFSSPVIDISISGTSLDVTGLNAYTTYYWRVLAENPAGQSAFSASRIFYTAPSSAPATPSLSGPPDGVECQSITPALFWMGVSGITLYNLQVDNNSDFSSPVYSQNNIEAYSQEVSGLSAGTTYYWRVQAVHNCGNLSEWSSSRSFNTMPTTIAPPSLIDPSSGSECQPANLTLSWESMPHIMNYYLEVDDNNDFSSNEDGVNTGGNSHTCSGLSQNSIYYWRVSAHSCGVNGAWSEPWSFETGSSGMEVPVLVFPEDSSSEQSTAITITWVPVTNAVNYQFQLNDTNDFSTPLQDEEIVDASFEIDGLTEATIYYWHVRASGDCVLSDWSDTWQFETSSSGPDALTDSEHNGYYLRQNYPNPFMETTIIEFSIPSEGEVSFELLDLSGRSIQSYTSCFTAGKHYFILNTHGKLQPGVYLYMMKTSKYVNSGMCILR